MKPAYAEGSLVNLVRSIECARGFDVLDGHDRASAYGELALLKATELRETEQSVLFVVDGLGFDRIENSPVASTLRECLRGSMTSVFPSTTASAVTTLMTGAGPLQHGLTGWHMWHEGVGEVVTPLPYIARLSREPLALKPAQFFSCAPVLGRLQVPTYLVMPAPLGDTTYTRAHQGRAQLRTFDDLDGMFSVVDDVLRNDGPCHVHAYWPRFDELSHRFGVRSERVALHLAEIDAAFSRFIDRVHAGRVTVLLTADHGFIDAGANSRVSVRDHVELRDMLRLPLCGEPRVAYCYPKAGALDDAAAYIDERLSYCCDRLAPSELLSEDYFGLGTAHANFPARIGEQILIAKEDYVIGDGVDDTGPADTIIGFHGGVSAAEMLVPLVVAKP